MSERRPIKISINALGGQGGGVLANWIVKVAESAGYIAQLTSVPGVAQRTGATIYYVELFPSGTGGGARRGAGAGVDAGARRRGYRACQRDHGSGPGDDARLCDG